MGQFVFSYLRFIVPNIVFISAFFFNCLFFPQGLILDSLVPVFSFAAFPALAIKAGFTALVGFVTVQVYAVVTVNDKY